MKEKKKFVKIIAIIFILFMSFSALNNVAYAEINKTYGQESNVKEPDLNKKITDSAILDYVGGFIYAVASIVENAVGILFKLMTGVNMFPWADKIIFNTVPFLDINFFDPAPGSLYLSNEQVLLNIVRNVYFTILSICIGFLGIIVGIMAIKLSISAIASEKAKYKESIKTWLTAMVLLFTMHYVIAFIFFVNEKMVEVASSILLDQVEKLDIQLILDPKGYDNRITVEGFCNEQKSKLGNFSLPKNVLGSNLVSGATTDFFTYVQSEKNYSIAAYLLQDTTYLDYKLGVGTGVSFNTELWKNYRAFLEEIRNLSYEPNSTIQEPSPFAWEAYIFMLSLTNDITMINSQDFTFYDEYVNSTDSMVSSQAKTLVGILQSVNSERYVNSGQDMIGSMGNYFKEVAWKGGWIIQKASIQSAILYFMFVMQSMMFFIAYVKRFFFVIVLSIMAPLIVVYDFFTKSIA